MTPILLLSAALQLPAAPPPAKAESKPLGPAPRLVLLNLDADGKVRIQALTTETHKVNVSRVNKDGKRETVQEDRVSRLYKDVPLAELDKLAVYTADGKEVNRATALEKLASGGVVVVTTDGEKVDPTYLKAFKDDMLVLVSPQLAGTPLRPTSTSTTAVLRGAVAAPAVVPALPVPAAVPPAVVPPPKDEKKEEKKDDKKDPPKKDEKKG
jgi:hypothetical protein